jgi:hypothetical protein
MESAGTILLRPHAQGFNYKLRLSPKWKKIVSTQNYLEKVKPERSSLENHEIVTTSVGPVHFTSKPLLQKYG